ncbi:MAG: acetyl-CoA acetyltransferase [Elusimicrobia bacterium]|nr:acetyl-CoA acetyltransferase [Elusimicrobiota bacterium]
MAIVGLGFVPAQRKTPQYSYREMTYRAARQAYEDAGISPKEVDCFITCAEDLHEGTSIFDEYTPDQLGAVHKPMHTVTHDGLVGLACAWMAIESGAAELVVIEAHSKASNILTLDDLTTYAMDPALTRPFSLSPHFVAGLEMNAFLTQSENTEEACAAAVVLNRLRAGKNPAAAYGGETTVAQVLRSKPLSAPLKEAEKSPTADGAVVAVVASQERARRLKGRPIWIEGISWISDSPSLESREWGQAFYAQEAAAGAFRMAQITDPLREVDLFEVDDTYAYKELQHLEAIGLYERGKAGRAVLDAAQGPKDFPVNLSGGCLGRGDLLEAKGLYQIVELVLQLRGEAGKRQRACARRGFALSWRGVPTTSGAAAVLSKN